MSNDFDAFVEQLQQEILGDAREVYSDRVIEEFQNPSNLGRMTDPDVHGLVHGWCGDTMELYLRIDGTTIEKVTFITDGCGATIACGSMLTRLILGKSLDEADELRPENIIDALDGLPDEHTHCAGLAISTLQNALLNWDVQKVNAQEKKYVDPAS